VVFGLWFLARIFPGDITNKIDFMTRNQTWIPMFTLIFGAVVGLIDDWMDVRGVKDNPSGGLSFKKRIGIIGLISLAIAFWFYFKLDVSTIALPFYGDVFVGWLFIPFFVLVAIAVYSGGIIDGLDGLAGGLFAIIFTAYAGIAFYENHINLAAFCGAVLGGILAFLWFNVPPARFYMSETGSMALTLTLSVVAFMTDSLGGGVGVLALPIIAFPLVITTLSVIIQMLSKKFRNGKKVFKVAPLHHHFEAIGWPAYKITMRYWIIGVVFAILGLIISIIGNVSQLL
jgi:phospho-N-acetylmuramoyl-pentapeptide-transferase